MQAAGLVGTAVLVSRIVGLGRDIVIKTQLGLDSPAATAFDVALRIPESIFLIVAGGAIGSAFIPIFTAFFTRDDEAGGWRLFSVIINLITVVTIILAAAAALFAEQVLQLTVPGLEETLIAPTAVLMQVMLLSPIIFGISGVFMGALNARQHFLLPAVAPIVYNLGIIAGGVLWPGANKEMGFAVGTVVGALGHLSIQLPGLRQKQARYTVVFSLSTPGLQQVARLMAPRILGLSFSEINKFVTQYLSSFMPLGSLVALNLAWRIMIMPQGILGQAMGIAAFPTLATLAARSALAEMRQILADSLRLMVFLSLPASVLLMTLGQPLIAILFQYGAFDAADTDLVAWALLFYAIGLVALTLLEVIARTFYALSDTLTPVLAGGVQVAMMLVLSLLMIRWVFPRLQLLFPAVTWQRLGGLALAFSLSNFFEIGVLLWLLRRKLGGLDGRFLLDGIWRMGVAAGLMAGGMWLVLAQMETAAPLWQVILGGTVGGAVYLLVCVGLKVEELHQIVAYGRRRWRN